VATGTTTPVISLASGYGDTQNPYASKTANYFLAAPNGSAGVPTFRAMVAADVPTLNQNTTGNAGTVTNGVYTSGSYADPTWITSLASSKLTGTIAGARLPAGSVLQVVSVGYSSNASTTSTSYADTGLSATITPSSASNKILVIVSQGVNAVGGAAVGYGYQTSAGVQLLRGATVLITPASNSGGKYSAAFGTGTAPITGNIVLWNIVSMNYLDSPATTSPQTYKTQFAVGVSGITAYANDDAGGSYITLMEIAG
jgi:hypothetical protein